MPYFSDRFIHSSIGRSVVRPDIRTYDRKYVVVLPNEHTSSSTIKTPVTLWIKSVELNCMCDGEGGKEAVSKS